MRYRRVSLSDALAVRKRLSDFLEQVAEGCSGKASFDRVTS
jgi:hypothetical protein